MDKINNIVIELDTIDVRSNIGTLSNRLDSIDFHLDHELTEIESAIIKATEKKDFLNFISNDALFSTLITILIFSLGILANLLIKRRDKKIFRKEMRSYVKHHIDEMLKKHTPLLKKGYLDFSTETTIDTGIPLTPPKLLSNDFQRILHVDIAELHNAIANKKALSDVISQVKFLKHLLDEVQYYHEKVVTDTKQHRITLEADIYEYFDLIAEFVDHEEPEKGETPSEAYEIMNGSIFKYYSEIAGQRELQKLYDEIIRPNQQYLVDTQLFKSHHIGKKIAKLGKRLSHQFNTLLGITNEFKEQYKTFSVLVENAEKSIRQKSDEITW